MKYIKSGLRIILFIIGAWVLFTCKNSKGKTNYPFKNTELSIEDRIEDLLSRMTIEEKINQLKYDAPAIERLGIPEYNWWNEALHGVARSGRATVFPQAIGLAAMFDTAQMFQVADVISTEARAKYHEFVRRNKHGIYQGLTFWSPNINIFRDPRWGRGMETYGEDPYLTGVMAITFIKGMQGDDPKYLKTIATSKHYAVHSGPEPDRHSFNIDVSEKDLRETYLYAFEMTVKQADVQSVMCAYNAFRDKPCCGSDPLLGNILRDEWGFNGYVVSDCGAVSDIHLGHKVVQSEAEAVAMALKSGTDLNCGDYYKYLTEALEKGLITEEDIDIALRRLLNARIKLGMFDPDSIVPYSGYSYQLVDCNKHSRVALQAARKSIVLLKNEKQLLPLSNDIKTIAVIGPNADNIESLLGNYNGIPSEPVTPLNGIKEKAGKTKVLYALGCEFADGLPMMEPISKTVLFTAATASQKGVKYEFFDSSECVGDPIASGIHESIDFYWWDKSPHPDLDDDNFSIRWTGFIIPDKTGEYFLGAEGMTNYKLYFEDSLLVKYKSVHHSAKRYKKVHLEAGKPYNFKLEYANTIGDACVQLQWSVPGLNLMSEALQAARQADVVILCMGLSPRLEGEEMKVDLEGFRSGDRTSLDLPAVQQNLIKKIHALGKPVVLVLLNGSALSINWENKNIPAIVEAWYPGQAGGEAIADVLFGKYNPSGRLPVTFYKSVNDLPPFEDYSMKNRTYRYFEGDALYPFGYGLSYTKFTYSPVILDKMVVNKGESLTAKVKITNSGDFDGEEVVQLYIEKKHDIADYYDKYLKGFQRIYIPKGETVEVNFLITPQMLSFWDDTANDFKQSADGYLIMIGGSSAEGESKVLNVE
ncbi:MAG: glycoside hydrolase family 3 C-terminal domain-containing protein [Bacteroidales bacterium]|nr:glycoside hydrolase family 3 C-terminal domain-containing protein [Bacteroidales bacterium]